MTIVVLVSALVTLTALLAIERTRRATAEEAIGRISRKFTQLECYATERPTTILIAGGSRKSVDDALISAATEADNVRALIALTQDHGGGN